MKWFLLIIGLFLSILPSFASYEEPIYDHSTYTECKSSPEEALYNGGIMKDYWTIENQVIRSETDSYSFVLNDLSGDTIYSFSSWVKIFDADSAVIKASIKTANGIVKCVGNVIARSGCWSFLKGGFVLDSPSSYALLYFQRSDKATLNISISSVSLQPFTYQQWRKNQQDMIDKERKCTAIIHISDVQGERVPGASIRVEQVHRDFPLGSAISKTILGNPAYQTWFKERFNAAVFEDELKWYSTEPQQGEVNYTIPDQMLDFVRKNKIIARGHNIFWEDPRYTPSWVRHLTGPELKSAVNSRIQSLMKKYKNEFIHWDVDNEMLHYDFYEQRLGINTSLEFFQTAQQLDPLAKLFMNDYNVIETCSDMNSTVDAYSSKLRDLNQVGVFMDGIGLEGHFTVPNPPFIRAALDKLATQKLPIWLTEVDISKNLDKETQARYLEMVLREGFSHPGVNGIMLWATLHPNGCYQMCLTDNHFHNLPAGDIVDNLLKEWQTGVVHGETDENGSFGFSGFLGDYKITVSFGNRTANSTFTLYRGVLGATFTFVNKCEYTVWPGILANAGSPALQSTGFELPQDSSRAFTAPTGWSGRFWGRTSCSFEGSGSGSCGTGDCGSGEVECNGAGAAPPATLAEFTLGTGGQDFYDVSLVDGYNLPMMVEASGGSGMCATTGCVTDLNRICPSELKSGSGEACRSACEAFNKPEYCCSGAFNTPSTCKPSMYSQMFKSACPRSYSYAYDDPTSTFTCSGADYTITFCPSTPSQKSTKDTTPTIAAPNGDGSYGGTSTGVVDPAVGGTGSSSGQMVGGSSSGFQYGAGIGYGSGSGSGPGSEYGAGTKTEPGSGSQAMLADGSYLAGLAMGESTRAFSPTALSALAATLVSLIFL